MTPPKVVVFDLGKVLVDFDYSIAARKLSKHGKNSVEEIQKFIDQSPLLFRYETGLMSKEEFFGDVCAATGYKGAIEEFANVFGDIFKPIEPMLELHATLRAKKLLAYIFSNTNDMAIGHLRKSFPFFSQFDGYVLSYEHGAMKPDSRLYEVVERETGKNRGDIIYLDDRAENVAAGKARGWRVVLHETPAATRAALKAAGLLD